MSRPPLVFKPGDEVVWSSVNFKGTKRMTVEKVGRSLVYVKGERYPYRVSDGSKNDAYRHEAIRPVTVWEWDQSVLSAATYFSTHGLRSDYGAIPEWLLWAADVLRAAEPSPLPGDEERGRT